jgi:membrane protein
MIEVYNISRHGAVWGVFGMFALFWAVTPLASALRSVFLNIVGINETRSFLRRQLRDALAVLFILLLFFLFTLSGLAVEKVLAQIIPASLIPGTNNILWPMIFSTLLIAAFYRVFFPIPVAMRHILAGSLLTAILWIAMRPAFGLFLFAYQSYGTIFGGMKNMFISIGWLYYSFAAFLLGTELIATLRKKDALLLKRLFNSEAHAEDYLDKLMSHFGQRWREGDWVFREGDASDAMYYLLRGEVEIARNGEPIRRIGAGEYFGEMALLANAKRAMEARVTSPHADILRIRSSDIETLLTEEPRIAMRFLREMALRARQTDALRAGQ